MSRGSNETYRASQRPAAFVPYPVPLAVIALVCIGVFLLFRPTETTTDVPASVKSSGVMSVRELDAWQRFYEAGGDRWLDERCRRYFADRSKGKVLQPLEPIRWLELTEPSLQIWPTLPDLSSLENLLLTVSQIPPQAGRALGQMHSLKRVDFIQCDGLLPEHLEYVGPLSQLEFLKAEFDLAALSADQCLQKLGDLSTSEQSIVADWATANPDDINAVYFGILMNRGLNHLRQMTNLRVLELEDSACTSHGFRALKSLKGIEHLTIDVMDDGLDAARVMSGWKSLKTVAGATLNNQSLELLSGCSKLISLSGAAAGVTIRSGDALNRMRSLQRLELRGSQLTFLNVSSILQNLKLLRQVDLSDSQFIAANEADFLRGGWPQIQFQLDGISEDYNDLNASFSGTVEMIDGRPIPPDLSVIFRTQSALPDGEPETWPQVARVSREDGSFHLNVLRVGRAKVIVYDPDRAERFVKEVWIEPNVKRSFDCDAGSDLECRVLDSKGNPISNAEVAISSLTAGTTQRFRPLKDGVLQGMAEDTYRISVRAEGYIAHSETRTVTLEKPLEFQLMEKK